MRRAGPRILISGTSEKINKNKPMHDLSPRPAPTSPAKTCHDMPFHARGMPRTRQRHATLTPFHALDMPIGRQKSPAGCHRDARRMPSICPPHALDMPGNRQKPPRNAIGPMLAGPDEPAAEAIEALVELRASDGSTRYLFTVHLGPVESGALGASPVLLGRPPNLPFSLAAAALGGLFTLPPFSPSRAAIHASDPVAPSSNAGSQTSASSFGQCSPKPDGVISISERASASAPESP